MITDLCDFHMHNPRKHQKIGHFFSMNVQNQSMTVIGEKAVDKTDMILRGQILENLFTGSQMLHRVNNMAIFEYFKMNMRAGRTPATTHFCYHLALLDFISKLDQIE